MDSEEAIGKFVVAYPEYAGYRENLTVREKADGRFAMYLAASQRSSSSSSSIIQVGWVKRDGSYCFRQKHLQDAKRQIRFVERQRQQP